MINNLLMTPHRLAHISLLFILLKVIICIDFYPEGVHIAKGVTSGEIRISWTTMRNPMDTRVQYGYNSSNLFATQNGTRYELITMGRVETLHYVTIPGLRHSTEYCEYILDGVSSHESDIMSTSLQGWVRSCMVRFIFIQNIST